MGWPFKDFSKKALSEYRIFTNAYPQPNQTMEKLMIKNVLKTLTSVRTAFVVATGIPLFAAMSVSAQDPNPAPQGGGEASAAAVVVTGSNIPTAEEVTPSNVDTLTSADVARSGAGGDVLQVLQKRDPDFTGGGNLGGTNANISSGSTLGGSIISIRGLPTLVLLDGRRIADSAAIATGGAHFTDVSLFPTALLSRIEVLKDGASALYGSEAVGGVVNIFLKTDFTGLEIGFRYGFSVEPGVAERRAYAIAGVGNETTHVTAAFQYYEIDPLYQHERVYSQKPGGVTTTYAGVGRDRLSRFLLNPGLNSPFDAGVVSGSVPVPPAPQYDALSAAYTRASTAQVTSFDLTKLPTSTLKERNTDEFASFTHDIFGKQLEVFGDELYSHNSNFQQLNGQPLSNATGVVILGSTRVDPITGALVAENRGTPAMFNPFQLSIDGNTLAGTNRLTAANRFQAHPRTFDNDSNFYRLLGGLRSQINKDWFAEVATYYSHYTIEYVNGGLVDAGKLNSLIAGNSAAFPNQSFDFFAHNPIGEGGLTGAAFNSIFGSNLRKLDSYQKAFDAKVTGFPFEIPGGPVGVSAGAEFRDEGFKVTDSPEIFVGSVPIGNIDVGRGISSFYGEASFPLVGSQMHVPGVYSLEFAASGRHDHYEGVTKDANVPKLTLRYQPIKDLTLRTTYSNSFVAPTLYQLSGPSSTGFSDTLTFNGQTQDQAQVLVTSNPNLVPSTAETWTAGMVYSPSYISGLTITADYFRVLQQQIVGNLGGAVILNSVQNLGPASPYYGQVAFNNFPGQPGATTGTGPAGSLAGNLAATFYLDPLVNIGAYRVEGMDLSIRKIWDLHRFGELETGINSVIFFKQDAKTLPFHNYYNAGDQVGSEALGATPDYKVTFLTEYRVQGFTLSLQGNYTPSMRNIVGVDPETVDQHNLPLVEDYFIADGRLSYEFKRQPKSIEAVASKDAKESKAVAGSASSAGVYSPFDRMLDGLKLTVGCNNLLNEDPRFVAGANSATNLATYDPYGQFVYFEIAHKF